MFRPNKESDTECKEPISQNNLGQVDGSWSTSKKVLGWDLDTIAHLIRLPPIQQDRVAAALAANPRKAHSTSLWKWRKILGLLRIITLAVTGLRGMFARVQHDLKRETGRHVQITADVQD